MPNIEMLNFSDGIEASNYSVHSMTGVDKIHATGVFGKGVKVAVVDTGVDYSHPAVRLLNYTRTMAKMASSISNV